MASWCWPLRIRSRSSLLILGFTASHAYFYDSDVGPRNRQSVFLFHFQRSLLSWFDGKDAAAGIRCAGHRHHCWSEGRSWSSDYTSDFALSPHNVLLVLKTIPLFILRVLLGKKSIVNRSVIRAKVLIETECPSGFRSSEAGDKSSLWTLSFRRWLGVPSFMEHIEQSLKYCFSSSIPLYLMNVINRRPVCLR